MAHISRQEYFKYLTDKLGDIPFAIDRGNKINIWQNCKDAWRLNDGKSDWHLVLQDDSIIPDNFIEMAEQVLSRLKKEYVVSFYAGEKLRPAIEINKEKGLPYVIDRRLHNENAICIRRERVEEMINFCDRRSATDDRKINIWSRSKGLSVYYPIPSIVQHRIIPSVYRALHREYLKDSPRQAVWYIEEKDCGCNEEFECEKHQKERQEANDFWLDVITN